MIRLRPHSSLFEAFHNQRLAPCLIRAYSTREPDSKSVNYPLLNRLYQGNVYILRTSVLHIDKIPRIY